MRRIFLLTLLFSLFASTESDAQFLFTRGDSNLDGGTDISDGVNILGILFQGVPDPGCADARDSNDDGANDIADAVYIFSFLFLGGEPPLPPFGECGCDDTEDALTCETPPPTCADAGPCTGGPECFDQEALDQAIEDTVPPEVCIAIDAATLEQGDLLVTVCPSTIDPQPMCSGEPGCAVEFTEITATLDVEERLVSAMIAGQISEMPLLIDNTALGSQQVCSVNVTFNGDAEIPLLAEDDGLGNLILLEVQAPVFDRDTIKIEMEASGGVLCSLLPGLQDIFIDDLINELEAASGELLVDLNAELSGQTLCEQE